MSAHDRHLADFRREDVTVTCSFCNNVWDDVLESEYGASYLVGSPECSRCLSSGDDLIISDYEGDGAIYDNYARWEENDG